MAQQFLRRGRRAIVLPSIAVAVLSAGAATGLLGLCGPFTDVSDPAFRASVLEIYTLGITTGTTAAA
jgi:hypothetical protein